MPFIARLHVETRETGSKKKRKSASAPAALQGPVSSFLSALRLLPVTSPIIWLSPPARSDYKTLSSFCAAPLRRQGGKKTPKTLWMTRADPSLSHNWLRCLFLSLAAGA